MKISTLYNLIHQIKSKTVDTEGIVFYTNLINNFQIILILLVLSGIALLLWFTLKNKVIMYSGNLKKETNENKQFDKTLNCQITALYNILDCSNTKVYSVDRQYRYINFNHSHAMYMQTNYNAKIEIGNSMLEYIPLQKNREIIRKNLDRVLAGEQRVDKSYSEKESNTQHYFQVYHYPIKTETGEIIGVTVLEHNVTEQKRIEDKLRYTAMRLNEAQRMAHIGSWELELETNTITLSDESYRIFEIDPEKLDITYKIILDAIHPDDRKAVKWAFTNSLKTRIPYSIEHRLDFGEGRIKFVHEKCETIYENDKPVRSVGTIEDITKRKQAEKALRESEERLRVATEVTKIGIWNWLLKDDIWYTTPTYYTMLGYEPVAGFSDRDLWVTRIHPDDRECVVTKIKDVLSGAASDYRYETRMKHADGSYRWHSVIGSTVEKDKEGKPLRLTGVRIDITDQKQVEEKLIESEQRKSIQNQISNIFLSLTDEEMYSKVLEIVLQVMKSHYGVFGFIEKNGDLVIPSMTREIWEECQVSDKSIIFPQHTWGNTLWGRSIREKKALYSDGPFNTPTGHVTIKHFLSVPIVYSHKSIGLISVANNENGYTEQDKEILESITNYISPILNARLQRDQQEKERLQAENELKKSEEKFRELIQKIQTAVVVHGADTQILIANQKAQELLGLTEDQILRKKAIDPSWYIFLKDGTKLSLEEYPVNQVITTLQPVRNLIVGVHRPARDNDIWLLVNADPVFDNEKNITQVIVTFTDITDLKRMEDALIGSEKRYEKAQAIGHVGSWEYNIQTTQFWGSDEAKKIYGFEKDIDSFSTEKVEGCIPERDRVHQALVDLIENDKEYNLEFDILTYNTKTRKTILSKADIERDESGHPLKVTGVILDITEQKQAEEQIKRTLVEKETLLRELYHRTKNNMHVIISLLNMEAHNTTNKEVLSIFKEMENRIHSMALVHEKLYKSFNLSRIDLKDYITDLGNILFDSFDLNSNRITVDFDLESVSVLIDTAIPCGLVLNELISNSLKHAFPDKREGTIHIHLAKKEEEIELCVSDNGIGFPKNFDLDIDSHLGLRIILVLVENQLKGNIKFESENGVKCVIRYKDTFYTERV